MEILAAAGVMASQRKEAKESKKIQLSSQLGEKGQDYRGTPDENSYSSRLAAAALGYEAVAEPDVTK